MPEQYASFRLRLQIEHTRLLDWGDAAGINNGEDAFNKKMKVNGAVVMALLSEMRSLLRNIDLASMRYLDRGCYATRQSAVAQNHNRNC